LEVISFIEPPFASPFFFFSFFLLNEPSIAKVSKHLNFHGLVRGKKKKKTGEPLHYLVILLTT